MFRPSTAPRWKIAMRVFLRPFGVAVNPCASTTARFRNDGALPTSPTLANATPPCFRNSLRLLFITLTSLSLKFGGADDERCDARDFGVADRRVRLTALASRCWHVHLAHAVVAFGRRRNGRVRLRRQLLHQYLSALGRDVALQRDFEEALDDARLVNRAAARRL